MEKKCRKCSETFVLTEKEQDFLEKMEVPEPQLCSLCRKQLRYYTCRNERHLYKSKSDLSGKPMLSMYRPDCGLKIYEHKEWWSDGWNGLDYGRDYDFNRPFFEQFAQLKKEVPHLNLINDSVSINVDYVNQTSHIKNCYLVFDTDYCEDCYYCNNCKQSKKSMDCFRIFDSELCYDCVDCIKCYNIKYSQDCENCNDSYFLKNCKGCSSCFGCVNLRHKQYCFFNEQLTKEEYEKRVADWKLDTFSGMADAHHKISDWFKQFPVKAVHQTLTENSTGDYLTQAKNCLECYDSEKLQDCMYVTNTSAGTKDCMDYDIWGYNAEKIYNSVTVGENASTIICSSLCWAQVSNLAYCDHCVHSSDLFGCIGLKRNQYCILNKQYSKEDYFDMRAKIIEHMKKTGEWGEFFPPSISPFAYNETIAQDYIPLTKEEAIRQGFKWYDSPTPEIRGPIYTIPNEIAEVEDDILNQTLHCETCKKAYRIIEQELAFYRTYKIPIPHLCHECRHQSRRKLRNPRKLYDRQCQKCSAEIQTTYAPQSESIVYCEKCYLENVY